jgi:hypothetical protein
MFLRKKALLILTFLLLTVLSFFGVALSRASQAAAPVLLTETSASLAPEPAAKPAAAKKFAIIIGIVYDNSKLGWINYADQDAQAMYRLVTEKWGFPSQNVVMLLNEQATYENITQTINWLIQNPDVDSESDVVFFYSGHGLRNGADIGLNIPEVGPGYCLVPFDFASHDYEHGQGLLWDWYLADRLSRLNPGRMWITIDSCFSGGFARPGITGPNRIVTSSSQADQLSGEISETQRGVLTQFMIEEGVARGAPIEQAFWNSTARAFDPYGQNPQIADEYPGNLDFSQDPRGQ